jgi:hypothetical protein
MAVVCRPGLSTCLMSLCLLSGHRPDWRVLVLSRLLSTETVLRKTKGNKRRDGGHTRGDRILVAIHRSRLAIGACGLV